jgi:LmbE family N-acetylglucosaminyl deacetylase
MNILVIAPHPDDEIIGCGGTLCLHTGSKARISIIFLTSGELGLRHIPREEAWSIREAEARNAAQILGVQDLTFLRCSDWTLDAEIDQAAKLLGPLLKKQIPDLIYLPHEADGHPDHRVSLPILKKAWQWCSFSPPELRLYEIWTPLSNYDIVQDISAVMSRKVQALRAHSSQLQDFNYVQAIEGLNQYRGALAGKCKFAEVFAKASL